jgi:hypothetical protein
VFGRRSAAAAKIVAPCAARPAPVRCAAPGPRTPIELAMPQVRRRPRNRRSPRRSRFRSAGRAHARPRRSAGCSSTRLSTTSAPAPLGPPSLCADSVMACTPAAFSARKSSPRARRPVPHRYGTMPAPMRRLAPPAGNVLHGAGFVVGQHHRYQRRLVGQRRLKVGAGDTAIRHPRRSRAAASPSDARPWPARARRDARSRKSRPCRATGRPPHP